MRNFSCSTCDNRLYLENSLCVACGSALGYWRETADIVVVDDEGKYVDAEGYVWHVCPNLNLSGCTWLTRIEGEPCESCALTRTRPADDDAIGLAQLPVAEAAKRHLLIELTRLGFGWVTRDEDPEQGLAFDMLSSVDENVVIGHEDGLITIDLAEGDDAHRAKVQAELAEPYRTMLGHLRHEVGHYMEAQHVRGDRIGQARELFGNEEISYADEIERHYNEGPPADWAESYISTYATMHPFEDFAESFAHTLHIQDTVDTARWNGLITVEPDAFSIFSDLVTGVWVPLSNALNQINRSMGSDDLYPFVIPPKVLAKLDFVDSLRQR
ncbi:putative zinc-binding metallopeptidase [Aeromicrobium sp. Leaf350]|uniref:zinc-binding metallopeptidase family protein n=1 Tax=Aeromicrobium sp. Leaf350 TaxID=2876565 RepID=UPI001E4FD80E|nr:putative zinc-binding metallopeptidase [Aeromicrobium sp. Leaf350]